MLPTVFSSSASSVSCSLIMWRCICRTPRLSSSAVRSVSCGWLLPTPLLVSSSENLTGHGSA